ncbi:MAG: hypothetical protein KAX49_19180, partial [Halanaerobiales bacterium]|nr:hypothetical protein [Halanaerobiales bacterium]
MLNTWIRLLKDTTDVSLDNQGSGTITTDGTSPIFYLGKKAPFNNFFAWMDVANVNSLTMTVEYWDGKDWVPTVDLLDGSNAFTQSGVVQFSPDKDYGWQRVSDTTDAGEPPELSSFKIYDLYWLKISFSGDMSAGSTLKQIAYKFTDENELLLKDSDLNEFLTAFGLTDWTD